MRVGSEQVKIVIPKVKVLAFLVSKYMVGYFFLLCVWLFLCFVGSRYFLSLKFTSQYLTSYG